MFCTLHVCCFAITALKKEMADCETENKSEEAADDITATEQVAEESKEEVEIKEEPKEDELQVEEEHKDAEDIASDAVANGDESPAPAAEEQDQQEESGSGAEEVVSEPPQVEHAALFPVWRMFCKHVCCCYSRSLRGQGRLRLHHVTRS